MVALQSPNQTRPPYARLFRSLWKTRRKKREGRKERRKKGKKGKEGRRASTPCRSRARKGSRKKPPDPAVDEGSDPKDAMPAEVLVSSGDAAAYPARHEGEAVNLEAAFTVEVSTNEAHNGENLVSRNFTASTDALRDTKGPASASFSTTGPSTGVSLRGTRQLPDVKDWFLNPLQHFFSTLRVVDCEGLGPLDRMRLSRAIKNFKEGIISSLETADSPDSIAEALSVCEDFSMILDRLQVMVHGFGDVILSLEKFHAHWLKLEASARLLVPMETLASTEDELVKCRNRLTQLEEQRLKVAEEAEDKRKAAEVLRTSTATKQDEVRRIITSIFIDRCKLNLLIAASNKLRAEVDFYGERVYSEDRDLSILEAKVEELRAFTVPPADVLSSLQAFKESLPSTREVIEAHLENFNM